VITILSMKVNNECLNVTNLSFATFNVKGQQSEQKRKKQYYLIQNMGMDFLFLQETHSEPGDELLWGRQWGGISFFSHGSSNSRGVSIHIRRGLHPKILETEADDKGRMLWLKIELYGHTFGLLNIYAPNNEKDQFEFYEGVLETLNKKKHRNIHFIMGGDFNIVRNPEKDKLGGLQIHRSVRVHEKLEQILSELYLIDIWRAKNRYLKGYTWRQSTPKIMCRLDMWFASQDVLQAVIGSDIKPSVASDHSIVTLVLEINNFTKRGPGTWKLNTQILAEEEYQRVVELEIKLFNQYDKDDTIDIGYLWDELKCRLKIATIRYCQERSKRKRNQEEKLRRDIDKLEKELHNQDEITIQEYSRLKNEFENYYDEKVQGAILRSRARWTMQGEKNTKYFYGLEKRNYAMECITQLETENGITSDPSKISNEIFYHFQSLYDSEPPCSSNENPIFLTGMRQVSNTDNELLCKEITLGECEEALKGMPDGKSPGSDGLPAEFYKKFWPLLKDYLLALYKDCLVNGGFLGSQRTGLIKLIPKQDRNLLKLTSWRPLTLLNVDYKILSKALAGRLKVVLPDIINEDQAGFLKGRYAGENIRCILDIAEHLVLEQTPALLVSLDIERAYDNLHHDFLFKAMMAFGINLEFCSMVKALMAGSSSHVVNNGFLSNPISIQKGVKQGDPISSYLFILAIETLASAIRESKEIEGIQIGETLIKVLLFADDTTVFLRNEASIQPLFKLLHEYGLCSGLRINRDKTKSTGLGPWSKVKKRVEGIFISPEPLKILGIWFCHDKKRMHDLNVSGKLSRIKTILNAWYQRGLTLQGKIRIAKTLGISILTYPLINIFVPESTLKEIDKLIFNYIWGGANKSKIKHDVLIQDYAEGGLKAPDIFIMEKIWKASWVSRLQNNTRGKWKVCILNTLEKIGGIDYLLACNADMGKLPIKLSDFWRSVFQAYSEAVSNKVETAEDIRTQFINNNKYILISGKSIYKAKLQENNADEICHWFRIFNGQPFQFDTMKERVSSLTWFEYLQIIAAIPSNWKKKLKQADPSSPQIGSDRQNYNKQLAKKQMLNIKYTQPAAIKHWNMQTNWKSNFILARKMSNETKLQVFQYKLLHRIIASNEKLWRWKIVNSPSCNSCANVTGTIEHMFLECPKVKHIWDKFVKIFEELEGMQIVVSRESILLGIKSKNDVKVLWNYFALIIKYAIYRCHLDKNTPNWAMVKSFIHYKLRIDWHIATVKQNQNHMDKMLKWKSFFENRL